ncbi:GMC oxidoreductase [Loktanella sp. Alg231-35]|uniref:GMC oxidoreductase n=1 Tax=Loktanella sp. Alg231-35 TaxID=1922220 RepID=UPI000D554471|nr:GMC family oxidoreductase [Loktanella sp. Alg231-35]
MSASEITLQDAKDQNWDVIIIGAGMGGGMAGRRLAERGLSVLFVEKGQIGYRTERQAYRDHIADPLARTLRGYWPKPVEEHDGSTIKSYFAPLGSGVGGSSVFYAAALERPEPHDLDEVDGIAHPTGGWPVSFDEFLPYFDQAEDLLYVRGDSDALSDVPSPKLRPPPDLTPQEAAMMDDLRARGLHPYYSHIAQKRVDGCANCLGGKCPRTCKMDGRSAGVEPALASGNATLLAGCDVEELMEGTPGTITGLRVRQDDETAVLTAGTYLLAAGSFGSPTLLLRSPGQSGKGCANSSDWVGRGLMFHIDNFFAVWPKRGGKPIGNSRAVSTRDFYVQKGQRLGLVQSMGYEANYGTILHFLMMQFARSRFAKFTRLQRLLSIPALLAAKLFGNADVFVAQMEVLPEPENRVVLNDKDPEVFTFHYTVARDILSRQAVLRRAIRRGMGWWRMMFLSIKPVVNVGHPIGTLRFGNDAAHSVLNRDCKAHDLDNLYVADGSFMPTSMGVNPSLTIAANALRVADIIADRKG